DLFRAHKMLADRLQAPSPGVASAVVPGQRGVGTTVPAMAYSTWSASSASDPISVTPSGTVALAPDRFNQTPRRPALRAPTASVRSRSPTCIASCGSQSTAAQAE